MYTEKKTRRNAKAQASTPINNYSSDELVIDIPREMPSQSSARMAKPQKQAPVTRSTSAGTPKNTPDKRTPSTRKKRRRPRSDSSSSATDEMEDQTFEDTIERCALKNNLTPECVKKLLKKLVMNEHVLAIVKLKEEDEEQQEKKNRDSNEDGTEGDDEDEEPKPKLTRLKAKQLNKQPLQIVPLKAAYPDEEVAALIREELVSDDDDEEYKPTEEEIHSDDDPNTTISDLDSQPRTPATPATAGNGELDADQGAQYSKDGLFKIPKLRNDSVCSQSEQEQENIARRTRSKLCLQTTAIETIESTFVPPDITTDMYDFDGDMDQVWKEFLSEFTKPLPNHAEDDDDTDPEYVAADKVPIDPEELRQVNVSKKELNELVSELLEMSGIIDETFLNENLFNNSISTTNNEKQSEQDQVDKQSEEVAKLNTPQSKKTRVTEEKPPSPNTSVNQSVFEPTSVSTPTAPSVTVPESATVTSSSTTTTSVISQSVTARELSFPNSSVNPVLNVSQNDSTSGQFFIQVSTVDVSSLHQYYLPSTTVPVVPIEERAPVEPSERRYRYVHKLIPVSVPLSEEETGFTDFQLQLFRQQLRMHVQFAAQNFMQSYAHPKFWNMADTFKTMLLDLQEAARTNPSAKAWNLDAAVECCLSWETELQNESAENNAMMQYLLEEAGKAEKAKGGLRYYQSDFHPKLMEKVIGSTAFLYPKLLPYTPFRMDYRSQKRIGKAEERLIAFGLDLFYNVARKELYKYKHQRHKIPTLPQVCNYISKYLCTLHTSAQICTYVWSRRTRCLEMNPVKHYFIHLKAPPYQHVLETIDFNNVIPPSFYQKGELPFLWDKYVYSKTRLAKINGYSELSGVKSKTKELLPSKQQPTAPVAAAASESNVNITISLVLDAQQSPCSTPCPTKEDTFQINPQFLDQSYHLVKHRDRRKSVEESPRPTLASYVSNFKQESSVSISNSSIEESIPSGSPRVCRSAQAQTQTSFSCCECRCHHANEPKSDLEKGQKRVTDYFRSTPKKISSTCGRAPRLKQKLWEIYKRYRNSCREDFYPVTRIVRRVYAHFKQIEGFSYFLDELRKMSSSHGAKKPDGEIFKNDHPLTNGTARKLLKLDYGEDKDINYAYNFFEKVEETLLAENKHSQYEIFLEILQTYNVREDSVADLYYKIENLLIADHPNLVDLFLTFLLPGQASEVGKFFEHFILTNANDFLAKLNIYFAKQPSQIKKIYSCLNDLSNERDVTMEQIKSRILPLLKGNPLLIEWFLQLFPPEKPPDGSLYDYEVISMKKLPLPECTADVNQIYEDVPFVEVPSETTAESTVCGTKYIQGRIVYGTLPARLSFLAHNCNVSVASPGHRESSPLKGCVHNVRSSEKAKGVAEGDERENDITQEESREETRYRLCDDATFKAHAVRLNPLVHGGKGVNYADVAHLLAPEPEAAAESITLSEEEKPTSPKKQQVKTVPKKRINSPINKKPATGKNSPTATTKKLAYSIPADSKVIAVSKKLKVMVESPVEPCAGEKSPQPSTSAVKRKPNPSIVAVSVPTPVKKEKQLKKTPSDEQPGDEKTEPVETKEVAGLCSWTRDEDKVILEEIKSGYSTVEELVGRIGGKIECRNESEIRTRYEFLMEVLKKFQKAN